MALGEFKEIDFLRDIENHTMEVIRDDGINRHLRFSDNGSFNCKFDLITWEDHLCITGDCGTYVYSRVEDMFGFFRSDASPEGDNSLSLNPAYWGEKLLSVCQHGGFKEFDPKEFEKRVKEHFDGWFEDIDEEDAEAVQAKDECWERVQLNVLSDTTVEAFSYAAASSFHHEDYEFLDFFDGGGTESYTIHYLWCLYGIVWGIKAYDEYKAKEEAA